MLRIGVLLAVASLALSGCSGSSSKAVASPTPSVDKCASSNKAYESLKESLDKDLEAYGKGSDPVKVDALAIMHVLIDAPKGCYSDELIATAKSAIDLYSK